MGVPWVMTRQDREPPTLSLLPTTASARSFPAMSDSIQNTALPTPIALEREGEAGLIVTWSDGSKRSYTAAELRSACPCATCREKHGSGSSPQPGPSLGLPVLSLQEAQPLGIKSMRPVGNYAYNIAYSDGHDSGIYTFDQLLSLGKACS
ncbi:MAG: gamma-butyrobetaine hydroxylase-like domain-containing protein [Aureliella sp.]